jgi:hypothetical protein
VLPPSVRFWGRRVYWAPVLLLVTAVRQGQKPSVTLQRLKAFCGVWRSTVNRWQSYFRNLFAKSISYRRLSGYFMPPIAADQLPKTLLERFCRCDPQAALVICLHTLVRGP